MIAFVSTSAIILLQKEIIYINPKYIVSKDNDVNIGENSNNQNENVTNNVDLSKYEGTINGKKIKSMLEEVIVNKIEIIDIYVSENAVGVGEAASDKANIILLSNAKIANNDEYLNIKDNSNYKVIFEKNSENVVQKIYVIKLI
jgi:hypothetical protein